MVIFLPDAQAGWINGCLCGMISKRKPFSQTPCDITSMWNLNYCTNLFLSLPLSLHLGKPKLSDYFNNRLTERIDQIGIRRLTCHKGNMEATLIIASESEATNAPGLKEQKKEVGSSEPSEAQRRPRPEPWTSEEILPCWYLWGMGQCYEFTLRCVFKDENWNQLPL